MAKKVILFLIAIIIIIFSFIMPKLFLQIEDISREKEMFARPKTEKKIDVQAEKIYLVKFIHDMYQLENDTVYYNNGKKVAISMPVTEKAVNTLPTEQIKDEISKLVSIGIIKDVDYDIIKDYDETKNIFNSAYTVVTSSLVTEYYGLGIGMEEKTGKIISMDFPKSMLKEDDISKQKQLENYAKYLDLDIIGDWEYENQILKSEKAQLSIILEEKNNVCMLTVAPTEKYEEYEDSKYEVVEKKK